MYRCKKRKHTPAPFTAITGWLLPSNLFAVSPHNVNDTLDGRITQEIIIHRNGIRAEDRHLCCRLVNEDNLSLSELLPGFWHNVLSLAKWPEIIVSLAATYKKLFKNVQKYKLADAHHVRSQRIILASKLLKVSNTVEVVRLRRWLEV